MEVTLTVSAGARVYMARVPKFISFLIARVQSLESFHISYRFYTCPQSSVTSPPFRAYGDYSAGSNQTFCLPIMLPDMEL
jgi:hypothetical protein